MLEGWLLFVFSNQDKNSPWRNRLARSAVNRKVGGSTEAYPGTHSFAM